MSETDRTPDLAELAACGARVANAMHQPEPEPARAIAFFVEILFEKGGRNLWGCLKDGLITETELRNATIARFATWLSNMNGVAEPPSDRWSNPALERGFEMALLGRPAKQSGRHDNDPVLRVADLLRFAQIDVDPAQESESRTDYDDGGLRIDYRYLDGPRGVLVTSFFVADSTEEEAQATFEEYAAGVADVGLRLERDDRLSWGDAAATWAVSDAGEQIGHAILVRKKKRTLFIIFTGFRFEGRDGLLDLVVPKLDALVAWRSESSDPVLRIADLARCAEIAVDPARESESRDDYDNGDVRIHYQYRASEADGLLINTTLTSDADEQEAQINFQRYIVDIPALDVDDVAIERDDRFSWGDSCVTWAVSRGAAQIGHAILVRMGTSILVTLFTGAHFKDREALLGLIRPKLEALDTWTASRWPR